MPSHTGDSDGVTVFLNVEGLVMAAGSDSDKSDPFTDECLLSVVAEWIALST